MTWEHANIHQDAPGRGGRAGLQRAARTRLHDYLLATFPYGFRITIADNASTDNTWQLAGELAGELPYVQAVHLEEKGRGRALRQVWSQSDADVPSAR